MSLFGNTGGTGLFGTPGATTSANPNPFGASTTTPATSGAFGQSNTAGTGGGLFGASTATPATGAGGGLFGSSTPGAGTNTGMGLFGAQPGATGTTAGSGGLFGSRPGAGTGLFGAQPAAGTGLFGTQSAAGNTTTGGLFGSSTAAPTTGGGLFGSTTPSSGTNLFGASNAPKPGGLFGSSTTNAPATGGLFGTPAGATGTGTGMFGASSNQPSTGLFGSRPAGGGLFGTSTTAGLGGFGQTTTGGFGQATTGGFGLGATQSQQQQTQGGLNAQGQALIALLTKVQQLQQVIQHQIAVQTGGMGMLSAASATTPAKELQESLEFVQKLGGMLYGLSTEKFQHIFYNVVDPNQVQLYTNRPAYVSDAQWEKAVKENPDPRCMVPVFAMGMEDLQKRADGQAKAAEALKVKLDDVRAKLTNLSQRHVVSTSLRSQKLSSNHTLLFQRIVRLSQHLHLLIPLIRSSAIRAEEEQFRTRMEIINDELKRGTASKGRINEMWGVIGQLTALKAREGGVPGGGGDGMEWAVVDEDGLRRLTRILSEQQHGLAHLTRILQDSLRDLSVILNQVKPGGVLASST